MHLGNAVGSETFDLRWRVDWLIGCAILAADLKDAQRFIDEFLERENGDRPVEVCRHPGSLGHLVRVLLSLPLLQSWHRSKPRKFVKLDEQPDCLVGGPSRDKLRDYQMDGINWLYYSWTRRTNGILADEMVSLDCVLFGLRTQLQHSCWIASMRAQGLGKTIQCIAFLAFLEVCILEVLFAYRS